MTAATDDLLDTALGRLRLDVRSVLDDLHDGVADADTVGPSRIDRLVRQIFLVAHCGVPDEGHADRTRLDQVVRHCQAALADLAVPVPGWRPVDGPARQDAGASASSVTMRAPDGLLVRLPADRVAAVPASGAGPWTVTVPLLGTPVDGRWLYWFAGRQQPRYQARMYVHLRSDTAVDDWLRMIRVLGRGGYPFQTKISTRLEGRQRRDGVVVYLPDRAAARAAAEVVTATVPPARRGACPAGFALPLAPGVGLAVRDVAQHCGALGSDGVDFDLSWGYWWARRLASVAGAADLPARLDQELGLLSQAWALTRRWWHGG
ncbi:T3SS effector HopA1 family protein [Solwaraspora sp. WMMD791]|uniref:T3SS effector HopA1 family protein n=1 Tax=Solwaraspora sp. WMMD791 TaxID=3016086 RepID=UPI00249A4E9A|nr:T3SS effector HopA1 family protein [Solwaraspora sp. WMMD791]WFE28374.1 T3SS effector HopA1 family protein [Solwaraspora sp. WMMD791]